MGKELKEVAAKTPLPLLENSFEMQFGATTFFAKVHQGDTCGSNGLPLTPNSIIVVGKSQLLKNLKHPYLCEYLDFVRGKHERTIVVSQYCGTPLSNLIGKNDFNIPDVTRIAYQILVALDKLHKNKIIHHNLSTENVLLQQNTDIKLFNYGLYFMTGYGKLVSFSIMQNLYSAPEVYLDIRQNIPSPKSDVWSLGIILIELMFNKALWGTLKLGQKIRKVLSLIQCNSSIFERIAREHNCLELYQNTPEDLKEVIESCLQIYPKDRPSCEQLLQKSIFDEFKMTLTKCDVAFTPFTIHELYYWWQLAGGDISHELRKQGLIRSSPSLLSLPSLILIEGNILGQNRNPTTLYDPRIVQMSLDTLYQRFAHIPPCCYYPLIHNLSRIPHLNSAPNDTKELPLVIKEKDPEYQFYRVILFRRLLYGYPFTKELILNEVVIDIPPLLRGQLWAALLNIKRDCELEYLRIDKETSTSTDRQIEVDIPRCHQYNELLSSAQGHKKLKRILKAWVHKNSQYVYWQGLDSLTAPFLYLHFNEESKAFACLSAFVPKYLHNFFLKDNSMVIQEYLAKFSQLIAFHEPQLANHLSEINFYPELFAIPWFLTVFSHVFPLCKILHLWDKLLLGDSSFPLYIGLSVLTQLKDRLLSSGFNECILIFSDLPEVDIEKCLVYSTKSYQTTPKSITTRTHDSCSHKTELDISGVTLQELSREMCPRISAADLIDLVLNSPHTVLIVDIRNPILFNRCSVINSINIPFSGVTFGEIKIENLGQHSRVISNSQDKIIAVIGSQDTDLEQFPKFLVKCGVSKVCTLHGGFNVLISATPSILSSQNQI